MTEIDIPFSREMAIAAIEGRKIATTRSEPKGKVGDTFKIPDPRPGRGHLQGAFNPKFRLLDIFPVNLSTVKCEYYRLEGFDSPEDFEKTWRALHRGHFTVDKPHCRPYYTHFFGRVI